MVILFKSRYFESVLKMRRRRFLHYASFATIGRKDLGDLPHGVLQPQPLEYLELSNVLVVEEVSGNNNAKTKTKQNDDEHSDSSGLRGLLRISVSHSSLGLKSEMSKTVDSTDIIRTVIPLFWTLWKLDWTWKCVSVGSWH